MQHGGGCRDALIHLAPRAEHSLHRAVQLHCRQPVSSTSGRLDAEWSKGFFNPGGWRCVGRVPCSTGRMLQRHQSHLALREVGKAAVCSPLQAARINAANCTRYMPWHMFVYGAVQGCLQEKVECCARSPPVAICSKLSKRATCSGCWAGPLHGIHMAASKGCAAMPSSCRTHYCAAMISIGASSRDRRDRICTSVWQGACRHRMRDHTCPFFKLASTLVITNAPYLHAWRHGACQVSRSRTTEELRWKAACIALAPSVAVRTSLSVGFAACSNTIGLCRLLSDLLPGLQARANRRLDSRVSHSSNCSDHAPFECAACFSRLCAGSHSRREVGGAHKPDRRGADGLALQGCQDPWTVRRHLQR